MSGLSEEEQQIYDNLMSLCLEQYGHIDKSILHVAILSEIFGDDNIEDTTEGQEERENRYKKYDHSLDIFYTPKNISLHEIKETIK
jgi:hypothetical protein